MMQGNKFTLNDYEKKPAFASFLPGIAGLRGKPMWCYYVNRGQGVVSFGVENKDHAIMEFYPAHTAYQNAGRTGFRTFLRIDGKVYEAFAGTGKTHMDISMNTMGVTWEDEDIGVKVNVLYYILPEEPVASLVRRVEVENISSKDISVELLDGMPALLPYGVDLKAQKEMTETSKAWMEAHVSDEGAGIYRVRASMEDSAEVSAVTGGNFAIAYDQMGEKLPVIIDPKAVFGYDTGLGRAVVFEDGGIDAVMSVKQYGINRIPCAFFTASREIKQQKKIIINELYSQAGSDEHIKSFTSAERKESWFEGKSSRAMGLTDELCSVIGCETADAMFDEYSKYTYMDNALRGGLPITLGHNKVFYVYSRKHGDLERDYNYFSMRPEYYSQGNANFRDVNQNRRNDIFFALFTDKKNIHIFYNLIQPDGYNPLGVEMEIYTIDPAKAEGVLTGLEDCDRLKSVLSRPFTPGEVAELTDSEVFSSIMDFAEGRVRGNFGEGYWSDHWDYNLDLIEEYISVYPDRMMELLMEDNYTWFAPAAGVLPRVKRYKKTTGGIRQYEFLYDLPKGEDDNILRDNDGNIVYATLLEKLIVMCAVKASTLDPCGMGIEMEGGKPGWYDALNGLPGMIGSSMAESCELLRMVLWVKEALKEVSDPVCVMEEAVGLIKELDEAVVSYISEQGKPDDVKSDEAVACDARSMTLWNRMNDAREKYRETIYGGLSGEKGEVSVKGIQSFIEHLEWLLKRGVKKAASLSEQQTDSSVFPTYFYYEMDKYTEEAEGIHPESFVLHMMPAFLEGSVKYIRLPHSADERKDIYRRVKNSKLYDERLHMYKVNADLSSASIEIGRCRSFTPGWLENESVWLHMEYKYLLELIRNGLYEEFFADFKNACTAFMDSDTYGRNPLENSSFIVSSANPDTENVGRGFVARLSGSTAEFLSMWRRMFFGEAPFILDGSECKFAPKPALPDYLIPDDGVVSATLLGEIRVIYHFDKKRNIIPGDYEIERYEVTSGGKTYVHQQSTLSAELTEVIRSKKAEAVDIFIKK